jgi:hypothetical protein
MRTLANVLVAIAVAMCVQVEAANSWGTDMSDLWWNPNESGWGANIAHQQNIVFMTMFVYGADSKPKWYVASAMAAQGNGDSAPYVFSGTLYETVGPYYGGAFNPNVVGNRVVGTATLTFPYIESGTLSYSIDGASVTKSIQRQTFRTGNLAGLYNVAAVGATSGCGSASGVGENWSRYTVTHTASSLSIVQSNSANGVNCNYSGSYTQAGRVGASSGTMTCSNGYRVPFRVFELEAGQTGFLARYAIDYGGGCTETGRLSGVRR